MSERQINMTVRELAALDNHEFQVALNARKVRVQAANRDDRITFDTFTADGYQINDQITVTIRKAE